MSIVAQFKWADVICAYDVAFRKAFTDTNKQKLYFSFEEKVEGVKDPWMLLSFLDGMLQCLEPFLTPVSAKRAFNQKQIFETSLRDVLIEKVFAVKSIFRKATFTDISFVLENNFMIWTSFDNLRHYLHSTKVSSKRIVEDKRKLLVDKIIDRISTHGDISLIMSKLASESLMQIQIFASSIIELELTPETFYAFGLSTERDDINSTAKDGIVIAKEAVSAISI